MYRKEIVFDRETRDYAMYLDGELTGFAHTYHKAEVTLDQLVYELITSDLTYTATELDGGAIPPWSDDPQPGRAIGRMWHKQPRDFIAVLRQLDVTAWITLAEAYAEWRGGDVTSVLDCWMLAAQGADVPTNARS